MPRDIAKNFGSGRGSYEAADDYASGNADDQAVLSLIEIGMPGDETGVIWVVSSDHQDAFTTEHRDLGHWVIVLGSYGVDPEEVEV